MCSAKGLVGLGVEVRSTNSIVPQPGAARRGMATLLPVYEGTAFFMFRPGWPDLPGPSGP